MRAVESQWWVIELPDEWQAEQEDDAIVIGDEDGVGEIVITTLQKEQGLAVTDEELQDYAQDLQAEYGAGKPIILEAASGFYFAFQEDDMAFREWYLRCDDLLILVTYCCDLDNAGMDDGAVDEILATLYIKSPEEKAVH